MGRAILVFLPGDLAKIGLYLPDRHDEWHEEAVAYSHEGNTVIQAINMLLKQEGLTIHDLTAVGTYAGPAPYAQLRTHITTANALAWTLHIPIFTLHRDEELPNSILTRLAEGKVGHTVSPVYPTRIN